LHFQLLAVYVINLVSGLLIAEVAINQYETSSCDVPSSFKEFADVNLQSNLAGNFVSSVSLFINTCVLSYDLVTAGQLTNQFITRNDAVKTVLGSDVMKMVSSNENIGLVVAATFFVGLVSTQSGATLSLIASILCMMLFTCFACMVLPGIAMIHDPLATFAAQGTSEFGSEVFMNDVATFVPVLLTAMVYQNIVPTITKMLKYDRAQTVQAIIIGSAIPMIMYIAFCFTVLGGGALPGVGSGNMFLTGITASSVFGSAMACVISIAEELDVYVEDKTSSECEVGEITGLQLRDGSKEDASEETASFPSVALGVLVPTLAGIVFADGDGFVKALSISGSYGSPLLYGVVPVILAFSQRTAIMREFDKDYGVFSKLKAIMNKMLRDDTDREKQLAPGGMFGIGALAAGAATLISTHVVEDLSNLIAASSHVPY
jgi:tyrosine-specific transport protein